LGPEQYLDGSEHPCWGEVVDPVAKDPFDGVPEARRFRSRRCRTLEAIREDLVPWLLGHGDPVRERVEARLREAPAGQAGESESP
jgi:hypothetical protein